MAIEKIIEIDGKPIKFRASAAIPRLYRLQFRRDVFQDIRALQLEFIRVKKEGIEDTAFRIMEQEMGENLAYIMAIHSGVEIPDSPEKWLEQFSISSFNRAQSDIFDLWARNEETQSEAKKK